MRTLFPRLFNHATSFFRSANLKSSELIDSPVELKSFKMVTVKNTTSTPETNKEDEKKGNEFKKEIKGNSNKVFMKYVGDFLKEKDKVNNYNNEVENNKQIKGSENKSKELQKLEITQYYASLISSCVDAEMKEQIEVSEVNKDYLKSKESRDNLLNVKHELYTSLLGEYDMDFTNKDIHKIELCINTNIIQVYFLNKLKDKQAMGSHFKSMSKVVLNENSSSDKGVITKAVQAQIKESKINFNKKLDMQLKKEIDEGLSDYLKSINKQPKSKDGQPLCFDVIETQVKSAIEKYVKCQYENQDEITKL